MSSSTSRTSARSRGATRGGRKATAQPAKSTTPFVREGFSEAELLALHEALLLPRLVEERMLKLLRQGKISKWFSGIGQEAIAVAVAQVLRPTDWVLPLHRNLGVFVGRGLPLERLMAQWQGRASGYTRGRDRSFHFGDPEHRVIGMISHLGAMLGVADGLALASVLDGHDHVALAFSGDGGASEGDFHEAVNVAAVWDLPVVFLVENNGYGLSTPSNEQFRCRSFVDKGVGYGIDAVQIDGNDILAMVRGLRAAVEKVRSSRRPMLVEAMTFRMRGHEEASGTAYVPQALLEQWAAKDPVQTYERWLVQEGVLSESAAQHTRGRLEAEILRAWEWASAEPPVDVSLERELSDVYAPEPATLTPPPGGPRRTLRLVEAVSEGLRQGMEQDPGLVIMGQDVAEYGGVFKVTQGFVERFGRERVRNTPLCESAIVGAALGLSIAGRAAVMEMQFADFVTCGFNQIVNNLAKTHYRWGQPVNVTVRMPTGAGVGAGPFHSQSTEAWFTHVPGLKVVYPSNPFDAKGLLTTSLIDPNPVLFFEHKLLYRRSEGEVPEAYYNLPLGQAAVVLSGARATLITYGAGVPWSLDVLEAHPELDVELIDLRTLRPWDVETCATSLRKTGRLLIVHEDTLMGGFGGEIAAALGELCFDYLDAPIMRVGALETPVPFDKGLEAQFLPAGRIAEALERLLAY